MTMGLLLTFSPQIINASTAPSSLVNSKTMDAERARTIILRLNAIKAMDKSKMNASEKNSLRSEVRSMQYEYRHHYGYYSLAVVVLVVLLVVIVI